MSQDLNSTRVLIAEFSQAILNEDDKAMSIAAANIVGKMLETQERTAAALETLAKFAEGLAYDALRVKKVD